MSNLTPRELTTQKSYDRVSAKWMADHWTQDFWGESLEHFHQLLPNGRVLEVGCGAGRDAKDLIRLGYDYVGTDISEAQLEQARINNPGAHFEQASLYDLNFEEPFNGFWCAAVLIHVPKNRIDEALLSIKRNMTPKAIGFLAMKEGEGERLEKREELDNADFLFTYWQNDEFKKLLATHDLHVVHEGYKPMSERTKWLKYVVQVGA